MVKENDTWQFANCHFLISKIPTQAHPTHLHLSKILTDSCFLMEGRGTSPPTSFSCLCYCPENFLPLEINLLWGGKKKMYLLCHLSLSFHQISWRRSVGGRARAGAEVIKLWVWGNVRHSQTSLTPRAVICQNELWSRILLITLQGGGEERSHRRLASPLGSLISHLLFFVCHRRTFKKQSERFDIDRPGAFASFNKVLVIFTRLFFGVFFAKKLNIILLFSSFFPLLSLSQALCGVFKVLLSEMRWIPSQAWSTVLAAGLW